MSRVWALRLVFISLGLLVCLFAFREALLSGLWPDQIYFHNSPTYPWVESILYDGWGVAVLSTAALYGIYRLVVTRL